MENIVMLAREYEPGITINLKNIKNPKNEIINFKSIKLPSGWLMAEKFDGFRAIFFYKIINDKPVGKFYSRNNKPFNAPQWFIESMPPYNILQDKILDGELWAGRDGFQNMGIVRKKKSIPEEWLTIQFQVYDIIGINKNFIQRLKDLKKIIDFTQKAWNIRLKNEEFYIPNEENIDPPLIFVKQIKIKSEKMMRKYYQNIIDNGGEGIIIKHPESFYENGRSSFMLKVKPVFDRECIIIDHKLGEGKYTGILGSFICKPLINHDKYMSIDNDDNHTFTLSGMDDEIRNNFKITHPIGTIINYECSGFTDKGVPRFGRYIRKRNDIIIQKHINDHNSREKLDKVIEIFQNMEKYYKNNYDTFRTKTYSQVNKILKNFNSDQDLDLQNLISIKGIGKGTLDKIKEIIDTNKLLEYEKIKNIKSPLEDFLKIHKVGPVCAKSLYNLGFKSIDDLKNCPNIQDYLNETQLKGLKYYNDILQRIPYEEIQLHEKYLKNILNEIDPNAELTIAGSYRRQKPDSGDIDLLLKANSKKIYDTFIDTLSNNNYLIEHLARGSKKYMGLGKINSSPYFRRIDIMYTKPEEYPFAILYFTGSGDFNVKMREYALEKGFTINEYSMKYIETKKKIDHKFISEKDIFQYLNYEYLEPQNRI